MMFIKRINIEWSSMTGLGPTAWGGDHHVLNMHTPHHENHQKIKPADDEGKAAINDDVKQRKEAEE